MNSLLTTQRNTSALTFVGLIVISLLLSIFFATLFTPNVVKAATQTHFSDDFSSGDFTQWDSSDAGWAVLNETGAGYDGDDTFARVKGTTTDAYLTVSQTIAATGYDHLKLQFYYRNNQMEAEDSIKVQYKTNGTGSWTDFGGAETTLSDGDESDWTFQSLGIGTEVNSIAYRFVGNLDGSTSPDQFDLDEVRIITEGPDEVVVPSAPILDTPADGATTGANVTLDWTQGDDSSFPNYDDSDYYYYYVELASTSQLLSGDLVGNFGAEIDTEIDQTGLADGTYYWQVRATYDPDGDGDPSNATSSEFSETRSFTVESEPATASAPTLENVNPTPGAEEVLVGESFVWEVDADDVDGDLFSLEIDHSLGANSGTPAAEQLDEFTVYASSTNPYGSSAAESAFASAGVSVVYDKAEEKWIIDFGDTITERFITEGGITFYIVLEDEEENTFGSMDPTAPENTFVYELSRSEEQPRGTIEGSKWIYGPNDGEPGIDWEMRLYQWGDGVVLHSTTTTDGSGEYSFTDVPYGTYLVCEEDRAEFDQRYPEPGEDRASCGEGQMTGYLVTLDGENPSEMEKFFGNQPKESQPIFTFSGHKFEDEISETSGLSAWEFELIVMEDGPDYTRTVATTTTDANGYYEFEIYYEDLPGWAEQNPAVFLAESYVREVPQDGWEQVNVQVDGEPLPEHPEDGVGEQVCYLTDEYFAIEIDAGENGYASDDVQILDSVHCDFVNTQTTDEEESGGGGGSSSTGTRTDRFDDSSTSSSIPEPQVLGETTANFCPFLTDYMQIGAENDVIAVTKLQLFLNIFKDTYGGTENPITGTFGSVTDANVKAFQETYRSEVLDPWFERGIVPHDRPTGYVYKTTLWKINDLVCPDYAVEPDFAGESLDTNVDNNLNDTVRD